MKRNNLRNIIAAFGVLMAVGSTMTAFAEPVYVNASNLNLRAKADMTGEIIGLLPHGTQIERTADYGEWSAVSVNGINGFAASRYLVPVTQTQINNSQINNTQINNTQLNGAQTISSSWEVALDMNALYAANSVINSGKAVYYTSSANRKEKTVCVNAGHGTIGGGSVKTLCHPDGSAKVTGGTTAAGATTAVAVSSGMTFSDGTPESTVTLEMAKILRDRLLKEGYDVLMIRDGEDVQLDNIARTVLANTNADCHIALHWDSTTTDKGCFYMSVPNVASYREMEPVKSHWESHHKLGEALISGLRQTGSKIFSSGSMAIDLTQTSYSTIPSIDMELGDKGSAHTSEALEKLADGLVVGINEFFGY